MSVPARHRTGTWRVQARQTADSQQAWTAGVRTSAVSLALQAFIRFNSRRPLRLGSIRLSLPPAR